MNLSHSKHSQIQWILNWTHPHVHGWTVNGHWPNYSVLLVFSALTPWGLRQKYGAQFKSLLRSTYASRNVSPSYKIGHALCRSTPANQIATLEWTLRCVSWTRFQCGAWPCAVFIPTVWNSLYGIWHQQQWWMLLSNAKSTLHCCRVYVVLRHAQRLYEQMSGMVDYCTPILTPLRCKNT